MDDEEYQYNAPGVDHVLRQKRGVRFVADLIPYRPRQPILNLQDNADQDVQDEPAEQEKLEDFYDIVRPHKMSRGMEPFPSVASQ